MSFFGELYLKSTRPFLTAEVTAAEVEYLANTFAQKRGPLIDLACGHGRHAAALRARGLGVLGVDFDAQTLRERVHGTLAVRADLRALPLREAAFDGAYSWYTSLFLFDDARNQELLADIARLLRPGGLFVFHSVPFERLAGFPRAEFEATLPDGSRLRERSQFDECTGWDHGQRSLTLPDGRELKGEYRLRYYPLPQLTQMLNLAGFSVMWVHGGADGAPLTPDSADLIVGAQRG
ncbi:MAG: class I SAM-dependent methyltransferase [Myxococcaceae bacterium]